MGSMQKHSTDDDYSPIVGFWHKSIERWKVAPEHLNREEELGPSHWVEIPEPPKPLRVVR